MNKIVFIGTNRLGRARQILKEVPRDHTFCTLRKTRPVLTWVWQIDPDTGQLASSWVLGDPEEPQECCTPFHVEDRALLGAGLRHAA